MDSQLMDYQARPNAHIVRVGQKVVLQQQDRVSAVRRPICDFRQRTAESYIKWPNRTGYLQLLQISIAYAIRVEPFGDYRNTR